MQVKFANGFVVEAANAIGSKISYQGSYRDSIEIQVKKDVASFQEIEELTEKNKNTNKITITENGESYVYDGYVMRQSIALKNVPVSTTNTPDAPVEMEERICVVLAQKTYVESEIERLNSVVNKLSKEK